MPRQRPVTEPADAASLDGHGWDDVGRADAAPRDWALRAGRGDAQIRFDAGPFEPLACFLATLLPEERKVARAHFDFLLLPGSELAPPAARGIRPPARWPAGS